MRWKSRSCAVVLAIFVHMSPFGCSGAAAVPTPSFAAPLPAWHPGAKLVVVGDLQRTSLLEIWREQNDAERERIVDAITRAKPDLLAITGDCVFDGGSERHWARFDALTEGWRRAGIPVVAAFGNHEYWMGRKDAEEHFFPRMPLAGRRHWYVVPFGPLRLILLDSNRGQLSGDEWNEQANWYRLQLADADTTPEVRGVFVLQHHPPYTNSTVTGDEPDVQQAFVPPFLTSKKTLAMLTGHVHSYERFVRDGKTYVVSGGGGGPRAPLKVGDARRHTDDAFGGPSLREFNFTVYQIGEHGVHAEVHGLPKGGHDEHVMDTFELPFPPMTTSTNSL